MRSWASYSACRFLLSRLFWTKTSFAATKASALAYWSKAFSTWSFAILSLIVVVSV